MIVERLAEEGIIYKDSIARFPRSTVHAMLHDRAYIGEILHKGQWSVGKHQPLVDRETWDRVQVLLGGQVYRTHELTYAADLIKCGHCGHTITGERKTKQTKGGERDYVYYRCSKYSTKGHPRIRLTEADLDQQMLALFGKLRIEDEEVRDWVQRTLRARTREEQDCTREQRTELHRQITKVEGQRDQLLNLRLLEEIEADTYAAKDMELRDRAATLTLQVEALSRGHDEDGDIAIKAFELSQSLMDKWVTADYAAKRRILEIVCLNFSSGRRKSLPYMEKAVRHSCRTAFRPVESGREDLNLRPSGPKPDALARLSHAPYVVYVITLSGRPQARVQGVRDWAIRDRATEGLLGLRCPALTDLLIPNP